MLAIRQETSDACDKLIEIHYRSLLLLLPTPLIYEKQLLRKSVARI